MQSELATTMVDIAAKGKPYVYKPHMTKKPNNSFKWLIPLVAAGQVGRGAGREGLVPGGDRGGEGGNLRGRPRPRREGSHRV